MSFHNNYFDWFKQTDPKNCPVCNNEPMPANMIDLYELKHSWLNCVPVDVLKGSCHVVSKYHGIELFDLTDEELFGLMKDIAIYAKALKKVTQAVKINYEIHGNTAPHLHIHLYPRYIDDPFPNQAINYHLKKEDLYQPGEYNEFVMKMRLELDNLIKK